MEKNKRKRTFDDIYNESHQELTNQDRIEILTDFINKLKQVINQGQFIIDNMKEKI
jgi:hypothetical protein